MNAVVTIAALALLVAAVPAHGQVMLGDRLLPPLKYDKPYDGQFMFKRGNDEAEMLILCPKTPPFGYPRLVEMIRADGLDPDVVWRHEIAHCHGWPADHPGAR